MSELKRHTSERFMDEVRSAQLAGYLVEPLLRASPLASSPPAPADSMVVRNDFYTPEKMQSMSDIDLGSL